MAITDLVSGYLMIFVIDMIVALVLIGLFLCLLFPESNPSKHTQTTTSLSRAHCPQHVGLFRIN